MGVSFQPITGWLVRMGKDHHSWERKDPYEAITVIDSDGYVQGFVAPASCSTVRLTSEARRAAEAKLGIRPKWDRIRKMAKYTAFIHAEYTSEGENSPDAEIDIKYRRMDKENVEAVEGAVLGGLLQLRTTVK